MILTGIADEAGALIDAQIKATKELGWNTIEARTVEVPGFPKGNLHDIPDEAFDKTMNSNLRSNHWLCQMVAPDMLAKERGSIMITASVGAFGPSETLGTYNISKMADIALVRNLAMEWGPKGVRVNALCPGLIRTDFAKALWDNPEAAQRVTEQTPLRRFGEADDFKGMAVFVASDASAYVTGQALTVCGGTHMFR